MRRKPMTSKCSICGQDFSRENHQGPADECLECQKIPAYPQHPIEVKEVDGKIQVLRLHRETKPFTCLICGEAATHGHYCKRHHDYRVERIDDFSLDGSPFAL